MLKRISDKTATFQWIDLIDPAAEELEEVIAQFALPADLVKTCLEPSHLPMFETLEGAHFILVRYADLETYKLVEADTMTELTRKIACFVGPHFLVTVHRKEPKFLTSLFEAAPRRVMNHPYRLLADILQAVLESYEAPLSFNENSFEAFELMIIEGSIKPGIIKDLYFLKRKISIYKRMIRMTLDVIFKMHLRDAPKMELRSIREEGDRMYFFSSELEEDVAHLLDTHLSLSANRTNDIVRVLTLFSVFFMPLTFIVGVYGMNFKFIPELDWRWGYAAVWAVMIVTCAILFVWFRKKGWLK